MSGNRLTKRDALDRTVLLIRRVLHLDESHADQIVQALSSISVCILADCKNLKCFAGQSCFVTFVQLVQAMGCQVKLVMPEVPLMGPQPPLIGDELRAALVAYGEDSMPESSIDLVDRISANDLVFVLGDSRLDGTTNAGWRLSGGTWWGATTTIHGGAPRWVGEFPVGAAVAAAIASVEPFKAAIRILKADLRLNLVASEQFDPTPAAQVDLAPGVVVPGHLLLGDVDVISAGAVSMAAMHCLLRCPDLVARFRVFDPDFVGVSNLNRAPLALLSLLGAPKVEAIAQWQRHPAVTIVGLQKRLDRTSAPQFGARAPSCLVGCDDIPTRWLVQEQMPRWVGIGSTADLFTLTSEHVSNIACARCLHREDDAFRDTVATVSFVSYWAGLLIAARLLRNAAGHPSSADQQALNLVPLRLDLPNAARWGRVARWNCCPICG